MSSYRYVLALLLAMERDSVDIAGLGEMGGVWIGTVEWIQVLGGCLDM